MTDTKFNIAVETAKREAEPIFDIAATIAFVLLAVVFVWLIRAFGAFEPAALTFLDFALLGFAGLLAGFVACIWCTGMWSAMVATTLHFLVPWGRFAIWVLAVAGLGTLLQVISRAIAGNAVPRE